MKLPEGTHLAYIMWRESYWYDNLLHAGDHTVMMVQAKSNEGGCAWEFAIHAVPLRAELALRAVIYSDSFRAFHEIPEFFEALGSAPDWRLVDIRALLESLGAVDATERTRV